MDRKIIAGIGISFLALFLVVAAMFFVPVSSSEQDINVEVTVYQSVVGNVEISNVVAESHASTLLNLGSILESIIDLSNGDEYTIIVSSGGISKTISCDAITRLESETTSIRLNDVPLSESKVHVEILQNGQIVDSRDVMITFSEGLTGAWIYTELSSATSQNGDYSETIDETYPLGFNFTITNNDANAYDFDIYFNDVYMDETLSVDGNSEDYIIVFPDDAVTSYGIVTDCPNYDFELVSIDAEPISLISENVSATEIGIDENITISAAFDAELEFVFILLDSEDYTVFDYMSAVDDYWTYSCSFNESEIGNYTITYSQDGMTPIFSNLTFSVVETIDETTTTTSSSSSSGGSSYVTYTPTISDDDSQVVETAVDIPEVETDYFTEIVEYFENIQNRLNAWMQSFIY